jgi:hypothetical protein
MAVSQPFQNNSRYTLLQKLLQLKASTSATGIEDCALGNSDDVFDGPGTNDDLPSTRAYDTFDLAPFVDLAP